MKKLNILTLTFTTLLMGCNSLKTDSLPIKEAVTAGTLAYIDNDPKKAQRVVDFIAMAKAIQNEDGSLNAVEINKLVSESIDYTQLEPYQAFAIKALLTRIVGEINDREIDSDNKVDVSELLTTAQETAEIYLVK